MPRQYNVCDAGTNHVILGPLTEANPYVTSYGAPLPGYKHPRDLQIGETALVKYSLSGSTGTYTVARVEDIA